MLVRTICFCYTRVDEHIRDVLYRANTAGHIAEYTRASADAADNNEHYSSAERTARVFHMRTTLPAAAVGALC